MEDNVKKEQITINLEGKLVDAYDRLADKHGLSRSAFGRKLVIEELERSGLLPAGFAVDVLKGVSA